ncbi:MAG: SMP-30/gluconolactonase/LRE family protein, partial [Chthoniobacterales bacterium]
FAQAGLLVSNTSTPGRIYEMSSEHHVRNEAMFDNVSNWEIYALQLEEERGESGFALPVDIRNCSNLTLANLFIYRVISSWQPFPAAVKVSASNDIRFRNFHCWTNARCNFDNAIVDEGNGLELRQWEFATLTLNDKPAPQPQAKPSLVLAEDAKVEKLSGDFFRLAGGTTDPEGRFYAVDAKRQRIHRWTEMSPKDELIADAPLDTINLAADKAGNLIGVSYTGAVYAFDPAKPRESLRLLEPQPMTDRPGKTAVLPRNYWTNGPDAVAGKSEIAAQFVSPDGTTFLPAGTDFIENRLSWGVRDQDILRAYGMQPIEAGKSGYVTLERDGKTYAVTLDDAGRIKSSKLFAERGGEAVATDSAGNVYIAEGQIFVYDKSGKLMDMITVPERPLGLVFGGKDHRTLYIPAGTSLYAVRTKFPGN